MIKKMILLALSLFLINLSFAQSSLKDFNEGQNKLNRTGLSVLGAWAVGNFLVSGYGWAKSSGHQRYFHQGNVLWNTVNLGLATYGFFSPALMDLTLVETIKEQAKYEKLFLFNAGLDFGYMAFGLYLKEKAKNSSKRQDMYRGYGNALLLQGGFLMIFDFAMFGLIHQHGKKLSPFIGNLSLNPQGFNFSLML
jgi:hypothetical protein